MVLVGYGFPQLCFSIQTLSIKIRRYRRTNGLTNGGIERVISEEVEARSEARSKMYPFQNVNLLA
jgi:hypothetical protein